MVEALSNWFNNGSDFAAGVALYSQIVGEDRFYSLCLRDNSKMVQELLNKKLQTLYDNFKNEKTAGNPEDEKTSQAKATLTGGHGKETKNSSLYEEKKQQADILYKSIMNRRAVLFNSLENFAEINNENAVAKRRQLATGIVKDWVAVSQMYDDARFAEKNGYVPERKIEKEMPDVSILSPEKIVKETSNVKKYIYILERKPVTAKRLKLINFYKEYLSQLQNDTK